MSWLKKSIEAGKKVPEFHFRFLNRKDLLEVLAIERQSFAFPWLEEDFLDMLRRQNGVGWVVEHAKSGSVVGYMVYTLEKDHVYLFNFVVDPLFRRLGLGSQMLDHLLRRMSDKRDELIVDVGEHNLAMQLFCRSRGLICSEVIYDYFKKSDEFSDAPNGLDMDQVSHHAYRFIMKKEWLDERASSPCADGVDGRVANSF